MNELLPDESLRNSAANDVWKRIEVDALLDLYLEGADLGRIAATMERNRKAIVRKLQEYIYNERDRVVNYRPKRRHSRKGKRLTANEKQIIETCRKKKIAWSLISKLLMREVSEINPEGEAENHYARADFAEMKKAAIGIDLVLAYRYLYYVKGISLVSDKVYDELEAEEIEYGGGGPILTKTPSSDIADHYPPHIRALGMYLAFKHAERK